MLKTPKPVRPKPESLTPKKKTGAPKQITWRKTFLVSLQNSGNIRLSCQAAGISRVAAYRDRLHDDAFRAEWDTAMEDATDTLELIARKRAAASSDLLLIFLLKAHRPEKFRENIKHDLTANVTVTRKVEDLSDEELGTIALSRRR